MMHAESLIILIRFFCILFVLLGICCRLCVL